MTQAEVPNDVTLEASPVLPGNNVSEKYLGDVDIDRLDELDVVPDLALGHRHDLLCGVEVLVEHHGGHLLVLVCLP